MRERIFVTVAGVGMLASGCSVEPGNPTPPAAGDVIGVLQTVHVQGNGTVLDTFKDKSGADLDRDYPHCDELDQQEKEKSEKASLL